MVELLRLRYKAARARRALLGMVVWLFWGGEALGGIVSFGADTPLIDLDAGDDTIVTFDLTLTHLRRGVFQEIEAVVGANELRLVSFVFSSEVVSNPNYFFPADPHHIGKYPSDVSFGFVSMLGERPELPLSLGTLTVDAAGLGPGLYEVGINSAFDEISFASVDSIIEPLSGSGFIEIVPEPATLVLLGVASVALVPRRRRL